MAMNPEIQSMRAMHCAGMDMSTIPAFASALLWGS